MVVSPIPGVILLLCVRIAAQQIHVQSVDSGVIFSKCKAVFLSSHVWKLETQYNPLIVRNNIHRLGDQWVALRLQAENLTVYKQVKQEIQTIGSTYESLRNAVRQIDALIPKRRVKRGWLDGGGKLLKTVFGTATNDDLASVNATVQELNNVIERQDGVVSWHTTRLHQLEQQVLNSTSALHKISGELHQYIRNTTYAVNNDLRQLQDRLIIDDQRLVMAEALRLMMEQLSNAQVALQDINSAFYHALQGKLTPSLLSPDKLLEALGRVRHQLPVPLKLIYTDETGNVGWYYKVSKVTLLYDNSRINISIQFPVADRFSPFDCYQVFPLFFHWDRIHKFVRYRTNHVLLVSRDSNSTVTLSESEYAQCIHVDITICPPRLMTTDNSSCEVQLFHSRNETSNCKRVFSRTKHYVFLSLQNHWIFTVNETLLVTARCFLQGKQTTAVQLALHDTGIIINGKQCEILGPDFVLPASLSGYTNVDSSVQLLYWPEIRMQPLAPANLSLIENLISESSMDSLDDLLHRQQAEISENAVIQHFLDHSHRSNRRTWILSTTIPGSIGVIVVIVLLFVNLYRKHEAQRQNDIFMIPPGRFPNLQQ